MKRKGLIINIITLCAFISIASAAFLNHKTSTVVHHRRTVNSQTLFATNEKVTKIEVCGFKDCKRKGGGTPLVNNIMNVRI
jgi:hypothetical protein